MLNHRPKKWAPGNVLTLKLLATFQRNFATTWYEKDVCDFMYENFLPNFWGYCCFYEWVWVKFETIYICLCCAVRLMLPAFYPNNICFFFSFVSSIFFFSFLKTKNKNIFLSISLNQLMWCLIVLEYYFVCNWRF